MLWPVSTPSTSSTTRLYVNQPARALFKTVGWLAIAGALVVLGGVLTVDAAHNLTGWEPSEPNGHLRMQLGAWAVVAILLLVGPAWLVKPDEVPGSAEEMKR